jgi:uncharacterized protein (DUF1684 family)
MDAYDIVDWRRRVFSIYAAVRANADPREAHARWRAARDELFLTHAASPLPVERRDGWPGLPVPDYDADWRFEVTVGDAEPEHVDVDTGTDGAVPFDRVGLLDVPGVGSLDVWRFASYGGGLFVPVKDASAGKPGGTYGGGRYLLDTVKGADLGSGADPHTLVLDFNFAYNPSCAYDPAWACPLARPGNTVGVEIPVGERAG